MTPEGAVFLLVLQGEQAGRAVPVEEGAPVVIGRRAAAGLYVAGDEVSRDHARVFLRDAAPWLEDLGSRNGTFVNGEPQRRCRLADGDRIQVGAETVLQIAIHDEEGALFERLLSGGARRDPTIGVYDERFFRARVQEEQAFAGRQGHPVAVLALRPDAYDRQRSKRVPIWGTRLLLGLASFLERELRVEDVLGTLSVPTFVILSRNLSGTGARALAERLRAECERGVPEVVGLGATTLSVGVSGCGATHEPDPDLVELAEAALAEAEAEGGNRVVAASPTPATR